MNNTEKAAVIRRWINPDERVTVEFDDARDLNAEVTGCNDQLVDVLLETTVPHMRQDLSIPLSQVEISQDSSHYTRDPGKPLKRGRLLLVVHGKRPAVLY